jgi:hypothetical protein
MLDLVGPGPDPVRTLGPGPGLPKFAWTGTGPDLGQCSRAANRPGYGHGCPKDGSWTGG